MGSNYIVYFFLSGLCFLLWVGSLVVFDIFSVLDDLTGRRAKRQLKVIQSSQSKEIQDTSEELRVLQQESLLDDELKKLSKSQEIVSVVTQEPLPIRVESVDELEETGVLENQEDKTGYFELSDGELSTGILNMENKVEVKKVSNVVIKKRLSNVESGGSVR